MSESKYSRWAELCILQNSTIKIWQIYMTWFAWFIGANLFALSWIFTSKEMKQGALFVLAIAMIFVDLLAIVAAAFMAITHNRAQKHADTLKVGTNKPNVEMLFAKPLAFLAASGTAAAIFAGGLMWAYVAANFGKAPDWFFCCHN